MAEPIITSGSTVNSVFNDPNLIQLLAGIGARLDPEGIGGALGVPAIQMSQARSAQSALAGQETQRRGSNLLAMAQLMPEGEQRNMYVQQAISLLGGLTPKGQPGVTGIKMAPTGGVTLDVDAPGTASEAAQQYISESAGTSAPQAGVTLPGVAPTPGGGFALPARRESQIPLSSLVPFY